MRQGKFHEVDLFNLLFISLEFIKNVISNFFKDTEDLSDRDESFVLLKFKSSFDTIYNKFRLLDLLVKNF